MCACSALAEAASLTMAGDDVERALRAQRLYYCLRAGEYDDAYSRRGQHDRGPSLNAQWQEELTRVRRAFDELALHGDIIELAAGTGVWTERLIARARSLTILDGSAEMLAENRVRLGAAASKGAYRVADLFEWRPDRIWDVCVFAFWLAKVPDDRVEEFLRKVARALQPGGRVCCVDKWAEAEPSTEFETRHLNDGRAFTIVDHPRPPSRIIELFGAAGMDVDVQTFGNRFILASGTKGSKP